MSESHGFHGTVLLVGTGTVVDDLAAELAGSELELERAPREEAVALVQLVAPDLLVLASDCATDVGLGVLADLADAGVTKDVRVLVVCDSSVKASGSQSTFRHVVRLPLQAGTKQSAARIKTVLARLTQTGGQQEPLQRIVDAVCGEQTKPVVTVVQSPGPRGAFSAAPPKPTASAPLASVVTKDAKPASVAGSKLSTAKKPSQLETSSTGSSPSAAKKPASTAALSAFANTAQTVKPTSEASRKPAQAADAPRRLEPQAANVAQPTQASAQPASTSLRQAIAQARMQPEASTPQSRTQPQPQPQPQPSAAAQTQGQPSPFGSARSKASSATMMQWSTAGRPAEPAKPTATLKLNAAAPPAEQPVAAGPWPVVSKLAEESRAEALAAKAIDAAFEEFEPMQPPLAAAVPGSSPISVSPELDVAIDDVDTRRPPAAVAEPSPISVSPALDVAMDDFDTRPPPAAVAKPSPSNVRAALEMAVDDFDMRPTPAPVAVPERLRSNANAVVEVTEDDFDLPPAAADSEPAAARPSPAAVRDEDLDATPATVGPRRSVTALTGWLTKRRQAARPNIESRTSAQTLRLDPKPRAAPRPWMMVAIVIGAISAGSAWAMFQQRGGRVAGEALLMRAVHPAAPVSSKNSPATAADSVRAIAVKPASRPAPVVTPVAPVAPVAAVAPMPETIANAASSDQSLAPQTAVGSGLTQAQALVEEGLQLFKGGRLGLAEAAYLKALKLEPRNARAMAALVRVHIQRGDGVEAVRWAVALCAVQPNRGQNHTLLGDAWALRDNPPAAESAWKLGARLGDPIARKRLQ